MVECCPHAKGLECSRNERMDEFYSRMFDAMLANEPVVFITSGACPVCGADCVKLQEYKARLQKQR